VPVALSCRVIGKLDGFPRRQHAYFRQNEAASNRPQFCVIASTVALVVVIAWRLALASWVMNLPLSVGFRRTATLLGSGVGSVRRGFQHRSCSATPRWPAKPTAANCPPQCATPDFGGQALLRQQVCPQFPCCQLIVSWAARTSTNRIRMPMTTKTSWISQIGC
jgi:hypothetical protein